MCGIFGVLNIKNTKNGLAEFIELGLKSESRGKEASGYFLKSNEDIKIFKSPKPFSDKQNLKEINSNIRSNNLKFILGHTRLKTHGTESNNENNQPCEVGDFILLHNGIITNYEEINTKLRIFNYELDSYSILLLLNQENNQTFKNKFIDSLKLLTGEFSVCIYSKNLKQFILYTNTGSLYYLEDSRGYITHFASEEWIINNLSIENSYNIKHLEAFEGILLNENGKVVERFLKKPEGQEKNYLKLNKIIENLYKEKIFIPSIKRCMKCILPDTVPFIEFDESGVCNFCRNYKKQILKDSEILKKIVTREDKIVVGLSGGRDSSFGLYYIKKFFKGSIIATSYDWGMITELARRNQARVTGKLGIEHVWVSADIEKKRKNIKKNLYAWLSKPKLGMIPILMAGDKVWQSILHQVAKKNSTKIILQFQSPYEVTEFKYGLANIKPEINFESKKFLDTSYKLKLKLFIYYAKEILKNFKYWNSSLVDSIIGYFSFNFKKLKLIYPFEFIDFDEEIINNTLENYFQWEFDEYNPSSWRIGDGTAAFYNLIYWKSCGFTENDFFRSNQIRDGKIERSAALKKVLFENQIKDKRVKEYLEYIDADYDFVIRNLNSYFENNSMVKNWEYINYEDYLEKNYEKFY